MTTRLNRYYNDPNIGAAMSNLAAIFAPPMPQEIAAGAAAQKARIEAGGLETLYGMASDPSADMGMLDRWGAVTGQWNPNQGFGARDMADATQRYGIDVGAATAHRGQDLTHSAALYGHDRTYAASTENNALDNLTRRGIAEMEDGTTRRGQDLTFDASIANNRLDNQRATITDLFGPLNQGQTAPAVPDEFMAALGLPGVDARAGLAPNLSTDEVVAQNLEQVLTPDLARMNYLSNIPVEQVLEDGRPIIGPRGMAWGEEAYVNPGSQPAQRFATYRTPDGRVGTAVLDPVGGTARDQATGEPLPQGTITGDVTDAGGGALTGSTESDFEKRAFAVTGAIATIDSLIGLVTNSPASQGIVGSIRGTAQNVIQTGNELGRAFGGTIAEVNQAVTGGLLDAGVATEMFDPNIPAIDMLMNMLAWQYAKSMAGDRVSNEQLRMARQAIGGTGMFSSQADSLTRLNELKTMLSEEGRRLMPHLEASLASDLDIRLGGGTPPAFSNAPAPGPQIDPADAELFQRYGVNP